MDDASTGTTRTTWSERLLLWGPGVVVGLGAGVVTAHGLFVVATAAGVPAGIAWLYPIITDGLALVAYGATHRLRGKETIYAWAIVVLAAGLSGLAQALYLANDTLEVSRATRFGVGAWPAVAAALSAHLIYILGRSAATTTEHPSSTDASSPLRSATRPLPREPGDEANRHSRHLEVKHGGAAGREQSDSRTHDAGSRSTTGADGNVGAESHGGPRAATGNRAASARPP